MKMNSTTEQVTKLCLFSVGGDLSLREYAKTGSTLNYSLGMLGYFLALNSLTDMYKAGESLGTANNLWNASTGLLEMLLSIYLGEHIAKAEWAGAALIGAGFLFIAGK